VIYPEEAAIARQLHAEGKQPTDAHTYQVHVAYDLLSQSDEAAATYADEDDDANLFEFVAQFYYNEETDDFSS
jgi:hypothetical protein